MENLTNQVLKLENGSNYFILRQATYKGVTYFLAAEITADEEVVVPRREENEHPDENDAEDFARQQ